MTSNLTYQGEWTSDEGTKGILELDMQKQAKDNPKVDVEVYFHQASEEKTKLSLTGSFNSKSNVLRLETYEGFISSYYSSSMNIIGNVLPSDKIIGTFGFDKIKGKFELEFFSEEDIIRKKEDIKVGKIKKSIEDKEAVVNAVLQEIEELRSKLDGLISE